MEQMTIFDYIEENKHTVYGDRGCKCCFWYRSEPGRCYWAITRDRPNKPKLDYKYPDCDYDCHFEPSEYKIPRMCANCKWANQFCYQEKPEYIEEKKRNGYSKKSMYDPLEEPNIYCTHKDGSLNRRTEYKDREWADFGVGHWHRQHEWDTCDRWELATDDYRDFSGLPTDNDS